MQRDRVAPLRGAQRVLEPAGGAVETAPVSWSQELDRSQPLARVGKIALVFAIVSGLITHGYHLFEYPLYNTDEGIYVERAWSLIREGRLSPQTYFYDHAPGGWIILSLWEFVLPGHFETFGNAINSGRALMLLLHAASVYLLFQIARKLSGGLLAPMIATFLFNFSPLAIYYQRMVLLDNMMVFWVLLSIYLVLRREHRIFAAALWSGLALGISVVTKENAIFFAPTIFYILNRRFKEDVNRDFAVMFWLFAASAPILIYFLFATLKSELLPRALDFSLSHTPQGHVSLLYELWYQIHRNQGTLFAHTPHSYLYTIWLPKDGFLLAAGTAATVISLYLGWRERARDPRLLVAGTLAFEIAFYLARGSVILDFYVIPLIPLFALNIGMVADRALRRLPTHTARTAKPAAVAFLASALMLLPSGSYFIVNGVHNHHRQLKVADVYYLPLTYLQQEQIAWIRAHIPTSDRIITDEDIWVTLHDVRPYYPYAQSHWNAASDPQVRTKIFHTDWRSIDYIVISNGMKYAMNLNNTNGQEGWILDALYYHSTKVWQASRGKVKLQIYRVEK